MFKKYLDGKIISIIAKNIKVLIDDNIYECKIKGNLKYKQKYKLLPGDNVKLEYINNEYIIVDIYERKNHLIRPAVANVDYVNIIVCVKEPILNLKMLYKYILFYEYFVDNIIITFTKTDLLNTNEINDFNLLKNELKNIGYIVFDKNNNDDLIAFKNLIKNKLVCLVGNSGVGKSSFLNLINPELSLRVQEISKKLNRGKHTTVNNQIFVFDHYQIIDTAGFGTIELFQTKLQLSVSFHDYKQLSINCKFNDCLHAHEKDCNVQKYINKNSFLTQRHDCYLEFLNNLKK